MATAVGVGDPEAVQILSHSGNAADARNGNAKMFSFVGSVQNCRPSVLAFGRPRAPASMLDTFALLLHVSYMLL